MRDGQSAAVVVLQVTVLVVCVHAPCVCTWRLGEWCLYDRNVSWILLLMTLPVLGQALNDDIPEEKRSYEFQLVDISEGGVLSATGRTANVTMVASDTPYGRFAFSHEQLRVAEEAQTVQCGRAATAQHMVLTSNLIKVANFAPAA